MDGVKLPHTVQSCSIYGMSYRFPSTLLCGRNVRKLLITCLSQELDFCLPLAALERSLCWPAGPRAKWKWKVIILWSLEKKILLVFLKKANVNICRFETYKARYMEIANSNQQLNWCCFLRPPLNVLVSSIEVSSIEDTDFEKIRK